jgi:hypothetical protein
MSRYFSARRRLTLPQQFLFLKRDFPYGQGELRGGRIIWRQPFQPTPISRTYQLRLRYTFPGCPKVIVECPRLVELAAGKRIPHLYSQDPAQLCLYQPANHEWSPRDALSRTILPWAALWLFYFEDWLISGVWSGGGDHPNPTNN